MRRNEIPRAVRPPRDPSPPSDSDATTSEKEKGKKHRPELKLSLRTPSGDYGIGPITPGTAALETPISPSVAVAVPRPEDPVLSGGPESLNKGEVKQICFGMDWSMEARTHSEVFEVDEDGNWAQKSPGMVAEDSSGVSSCATSEHVHPTHRVTHPFIPRHPGEVLLEQGDPVHVERECEDHWCHGTNLRSSQHGIFPVANVLEIELEEDFSLSGNMGLRLEERDTFYLTFLGSLEVAHHKGNDVLVQAINKILNMYQNKDEFVIPKPVILDISFRGIHLIDKNTRNWFRCPSFDYFYSLQNISFCGSHPKQLRYFGFITKHPLLPRFACHVFLSNVSTQPIVEALGRAFKKSYDEYMAFQHPTEDIYLE